MMFSLSEFIIVYLTGGLTFLPILIFAILTISSPSIKPTTTADKEKHVYSNHFQSEKSGWIRLTKTYKPKTGDSNALMSGIQSYVSKRQKELVYAKLKYNTLFVYESDAESECKIIIPVHNYNVSIYPKKKEDQEIYGKTTAIRLDPKLDAKNSAVVPSEETCSDVLSGSSNSEYYITCARPVDKEDWYFGLLSATYAMSESPETSHIEKMDTTHFDQQAMQSLISTLTQDVNNREIQWLNAIIGRVFLGLYKTKEMEKQFEERILKKVKSVKLPSFLGDIKVESVDIGQSIPFITQPKLLSMSPEGDMLVEANVDYAGGLRVVIKTDFHWTYSSLMKPISLPLVLSVSLKSIKGKFQLKIKPPPTNRLWFGFYSMPEMDWEITPIVSDKQIKLSMVRNAIQSKIREFMMEVLVLPNMDDISFYPSDGRGGIFGERVPKTSASSYSSPDIKLNKTPELVVTDEHVDLKFNPYSPSMRKAEPTGLFDTQEGADLIESNLHCGALRARGYSSPELLTLGTIKQQQTKDHLVPSPTCASSDTLLPSGNVRLRKRHSSPSQNELPAGFDDTTNSIKTTETTVAVSSPMKPATETVQHEDLCSLSDSDNTMVNSCTEKIELGVSTESDKASQLSEKDVDARSISERSTISNTSTKSKLLSRFSNHSRFEKTLETKKATFQNKKNAFYSMAGNMFKKNGVSRQVREERSRELEEMHQRKMMTLFDMPPPLPPRKNTNCSAPSLDESRSYNSSFEECDPSPVSKEFFDVCDSKVRYDELFQVEHEKHRFSF